MTKRNDAEMSFTLAYIAGWDVGSRSMKAAGRKKWNQEDYNAAWREFNRLRVVPLIASQHSATGSAS